MGKETESYLKWQASCLLPPLLESGFFHGRRGSAASLPSLAPCGGEAWVKYLKQVELEKTIRVDFLQLHSLLRHIEDSIIGRRKRAIALKTIE